MSQREKELMKQISSGWDDLKEDIRPRKFLEEQFRKCREDKDRKNMDDNIFKNILSFGATLLVQELAKSAEDRIKSFFRK